MRAFRVIRLFGRLGSLRDIITALTAAIIPVRGRAGRNDDSLCKDHPAAHSPLILPPGNFAHGC